MNREPELSDSTFAGYKANERPKSTSAISGRTTPGPYPHYRSHEDRRGVWLPQPFYDNREGKPLVCCDARKRSAESKDVVGKKLTSLLLRPDALEAARFRQIFHGGLMPDRLRIQTHEIQDVTWHATLYR